MKLWQLIKSHLGPYSNLLVIVVVLQAIATFAARTAHIPRSNECAPMLRSRNERKSIVATK